MKVASKPTRRTRNKNNFHSYRDKSNENDYDSSSDDNDEDEDEDEDEDDDVESEDDDNSDEYLSPLVLSEDEDHSVKGNNDDSDETKYNDDHNTKRILKEKSVNIVADDIHKTNKAAAVPTSKTNHKFPNSTTTQTKNARRRRRRSSARFLSLSKRFEPGPITENSDDVDVIDHDDEQHSQRGSNSAEATIRNNKELGEMYRQVIRMNTENRINAGNSWNFGLIENIDKFLCDDENEEEDDSNSNSTRRSSSSFASKQNSIQSLSSSSTRLDLSSDQKKINFTKASCTLDASVKIYSYRVDDVHLTSYKVLANLNRTGTGDGDSNDPDNNAGASTSKPAKAGQRKQSERRHMDNTIESKVDNINMAKIDAALDIDPLFHKMSKTFDEGGAKGLLLVNLSVATDCCRVVFDSDEHTNTTIHDIDDNLEVDVPATPATPTSTMNTIQEEGEGEDDEEQMNDVMMGSCDDHIEDNDNQSQIDEKDCVDDEFGNVDTIATPLKEIPYESKQQQHMTIDITGLSSKFANLFSGCPLDSIPFVPQIKSVRDEIEQLQAQGYVVTAPDSSSKSKRYAISAKEEKEAEEVIHREALERTRMSEAVNQSFGNTSAISDQSHLDDFDDIDGEDDGFMMNQTMEIQPDFFDENNNITFNDDFGFMTSSNGGDTNDRNDIAPFNEVTSTARLLDVICNNDNIGSVGRYEYFDTSALQSLTTGNLWAGSAHWKKSGKFFKMKKNQNSKDDTKSKKEEGQKKTCERTFVDLSIDNLESAVEALMVTAKAKKGLSDPLQLTKASLSRRQKDDCCLPNDAEIDLDQLFRLFLRPNSTIVTGNTSQPSSSGRRVGFQEDVSTQRLHFDGDDDSFGNNDEGNFNVFDAKDPNDMDDVVIKDLEGIRKVAKVEVEYATIAKKVDVKRLKHDLWAEIKEKTSEDDNNMDEEENISKDETLEQDSKEEVKLSFQEIVDNLDKSQSQEDVSVAFYFICLLHLANEKGLALDATGFELSNFLISRDSK